MSTERHAGLPADFDEGERDALAGLEDQLAAMRLRHGHAPPLDVLHAARHDVLPGEWQAEVDAHLASSAWSRAFIEGAAADSARIAADEDRLDAVTEARLLARIMREVRGVPSGSPRRWLHPLPLWIGAAAAASILIALLIRTTRDAPPRPELVSTEAAARPPAAALPAPSTPPFTLAFDKPEVRLSAAALVWRGSSPGQTSAGGSYLTELKPGLDAYRAGDYQRADAAFAAVRPRYRGAVEAPFYQGASRLLAGDAAGAIEPLTEAARLNDRAFAADTALLLAAAEQRTGQTGAARARLQQSCKAGDTQTARICAALAQLDAAVPAAPGIR